MSDKPVVVTSLEDETGDRCVDIIRNAAGQFTYAECRRDPEDGHGWRRLSAKDGPEFTSEYAAYVAALRDVAWLDD